MSGGLGVSWWAGLPRELGWAVRWAGWSAALGWAGLWAGRWAELDAGLRAGLPQALGWWVGRRVGLVGPQALGSGVGLASWAAGSGLHCWTSNLAHLISWKGDKYLASSMGFSVKIQHKIKVLKVNWDKPERGWVKINTDGASKGNPGISGAGGIVRNEEGVAILAFYEFIGQATNMFAEVFGLYKALQLCNSRGINKIWIEVDAKNLIRLINCPSIAHWSLQNMLKEIRITLKSMEYRISHIYREGNKATDYLANLACSTQSSRVFRGDELEGQISGIIWCDRSSIPYIRSK
ncbi:UNVERIFIED_CONTAM: putative ribonuclease H protein [Sesamum calycinum]|uniref:Ribonuclease H protein n=1 Tax=Sesamum calycinum TaxID=2727403 RepID=A0AAW2P9S4_9LAMI